MSYCLIGHRAFELHHVWTPMDLVLPDLEGTTNHCGRFKSPLYTYIKYIDTYRLHTKSMYIISTRCEIDFLKSNKLSRIIILLFCRKLTLRKMSRAFWIITYILLGRYIYRITFKRWVCFVFKKPLKLDHTDTDRCDCGVTDVGSWLNVYREFHILIELYWSLHCFYLPRQNYDLRHSSIIILYTRQ